MESADKTILVIGSGGREHALGWKLAQSPHVKKIYFAPGNGGTSENIDVKQNDLLGLISFAKKFGNDILAVVGPEESLSLGVANAFADQGLRLFGPTKEAAMLESSKIYAKQFMKKAGIPTAEFAVFSDSREAIDYIKGQKKPLVVKADGLAAGKGVVVCDNANEAIDAVSNIMVRKEFGTAGSQVVIEERLSGQEASFIAICDGKTIIPLASSQDHKRVFDGDRGPNTGGMGAYSPAPIVDDSMHGKIVKTVMEPTIREMASRGTPFKGFLYAGIMIEGNEPRVLEFNARMGDPECQPIMMRMDSDLYEYLDAAVDGRLHLMPPIKWKSEAAVCVVIASKGYPGNYEKGKVIHGLQSDLDAMVFHAGTTKENGRIVSNGGRVLGVTALGDDIQKAIDRAYEAVRKISIGDNDHHYRTDIGKKAL